MLEDTSQKTMLDLLRVSSVRESSPLQASGHHPTHRRQNSTSKSNTNSIRNSKRYSISAENLKDSMGEINKWDISSKNLVIDKDKIIGRGQFGKRFYVKFR
jgi:hypothetical protein